jgi:hypothetical protein
MINVIKSLKINKVVRKDQNLNQEQMLSKVKLLGD